MVLLPVALSSSLGFAFDPEDDLFLKGLAGQQQRIITSQHDLPDWLKPKPLQLDPVFEQQLHQGLTSASPRAADASVKPISSGHWIFVSFGMPLEELKAAAKEASETKAALVFMGVAEGENTGQLAQRLAEVIKGIKPIPGAIIDPLLFNKMAVSTVPTMVSTDAQGHTRRVRGLPGFVWLDRQDEGDAGQKGPVYTITEPDMIGEIKRRIATTDWEKQKSDAMANFWKGQGEGLDLPKAKTNRERLLDPSLTVTQDIYHPDGRLIAAKGQRLNPQTLLPMRHVYIIFDATQPEQVGVAKKLGDLAASKMQPVVYLFSKLDHQTGWEQYNALASELGAPVYQLNKALLKRFQIQALPTVIEGRDDRLSVREISYDKR
jgi:conjugal transfer pilus assembly protein TraW